MTAHGFTEINNDWTLDSDFTGSLRIQGTPSPPAFPYVDLNGHEITIDSQGIEINQGTNYTFFSGGVLTSNVSFLETHFTGSEYSAIILQLVISDSSHKVGLRIIGNGNAASGFYLTGNQSNTFTANVEVLGWKNHLVLSKINGATAVRSDILVSEQAILRFEGSDQLLNTSNVMLRNGGVLQTLAPYGEDITNTFQSLIIENSGVVHFNHSEFNSENSKYYISVDDLVINEGGHLKITDWQDERDFILVRKDSANLADALTKMEFVGYDSANIHLRDFNSDYWQISALPEPTTYGALFAAAGLGLWTWRKRHKRLTNNLAAK